MRLKLKQYVGIAIIVFAVLVAFFLLRAYVLTGQPQTLEQQSQSRQKAAQNGLFDPSAPPIIH